MNIQIKQKHIDSGLRRKPRACALTLAIEDHIDNNDARVVTGNELCHITIDDVMTIYRHNAQVFINKFDKQLTPSPETVVLEQVYQKGEKLQELDVSEILATLLDLKEVNIELNIKLEDNKLIITGLDLAEDNVETIVDEPIVPEPVVNDEPAKHENRGKKLNVEAFKKGYILATDGEHHTQFKISNLIGVSKSTVSKYSKHWDKIYETGIEIDKYIESGLRIEKFRTPEVVEEQSAIDEQEEDVTFDDLSDIDDYDADADNINILNERQ